MGPGGGPVQLIGQELDVAPADPVDPVRRRRVVVSRGCEQLGHDLRIGLAAKRNVAQGTGVADVFANRADDGTASSAGAQQNGAIDIKQDQLFSRHQPTHLSSRRRTATSRSRSDAARLPGSQGSTTTPPQDSVECTRVSASPANAT